jgi:hypothetical protein
VPRSALLASGYRAETTVALAIVGRVVAEGAAGLGWGAL